MKKKVFSFFANFKLLQNHMLYNETKENGSVCCTIYIISNHLLGFNSINERDTPFNKTRITRFRHL